MTRGNVIIQNVCLKISLGLFKTLLKDLSLNNNNNKKMGCKSIFLLVAKEESGTIFFFLTKQTPTCALKINLIWGHLETGES